MRRLQRSAWQRPFSVLFVVSAGRPALVVTGECLIGDEIHPVSCGKPVVVLDIGDVTAVDRPGVAFSVVRFAVVVLVNVGAGNVGAAGISLWRTSSR